jgi:hypothetical protein
MDKQRKMPGGKRARHVLVSHATTFSSGLFALTI